VEFGVVTQAAMAFAQVFNAFSLIVEQFQDISTFAAVVNRLTSLSEAIEDRPAPALLPIRVEEDGNRVAYQGLTLRTPKEGRLLIRNLSLEVPRGHRLLIVGHNGVGKSALFRATAGIWTWGQGHIVRPPWDQVMFLPQRPFLVAGTLRDQLVDAAGEISDERILKALRAVRLEGVLERVGGLEVERDWANTLSLGEQQELAFARLLLMRPAFAFLDHAASALSEPRRESIYRQLSETSITYISVGDPHPGMWKFHDTLLELEEDGEWKVEPAEVAA
jgi:putative ATP-binding cassette transporter